MSKSRSNQETKFATGCFYRTFGRMIMYNSGMKAFAGAAILLTIWAVSGCTAQVPKGTPLVTEVRHEPWDTGYAGGTKYSTEHYRIFSTTNNRPLLEAMPAFMEASYARYLALTSLPEDKSIGPMQIYLMGTRAEWAVLTRNVIPGDVQTVLSIQAGGFCYNKTCLFWDIGVTGTLSVAAHEGLHQFFAHRLKHHLPLWLEEGLCVTAEGYDIDRDMVVFTPQRNITRFSGLRETIMTGRWIPLSKLIKMDSGDALNAGGTNAQALGYYAQLWSLVLYIRSVPAYRAGLEQLLADAAAGRFHEVLKAPPKAYGQLQLREKVYNQAVSEPIFRHYISNDPVAFERGYRQFAKKLAMIE